MTIPVACPRCEAAYELPEHLRDQKVRCARCQDEFFVVDVVVTQPTSPPLSGRRWRTPLLFVGGVMGLVVFLACGGVTWRVWHLIDQGGVLETRPLAQVSLPQAREGGWANIQRTTAADLPTQTFQSSVGTFVYPLCWDEGESAFYCLADGGLLQRITLDTLKIERHIDLNHKCTCLAISREGLLVAVADLQEVWVVDPDSLEVKARFSTPGVVRVVSAPGLSVAFAQGGNEPLFVLDLGKAQVVRQYWPGTSFSGVDFRCFAATPDGKYLLASGGGCLNRFRIQGSRLVLEETGPFLVQQLGGRESNIQISPDSNWVCWPSSAGNPTGVPNPLLPSYSTHIYAVRDLKKPQLVLNQGRYPQAVGFDPKAGLIYTQDLTHRLIVFNWEGTKLREYPQAGGRGGVLAEDIQQYLVQPGGQKLLVLAPPCIHCVTLPGT